jgi:hypothetical protein
MSNSLGKGQLSSVAVASTVVAVALTLAISQRVVSKVITRISLQRRLAKRLKTTGAEDEEDATVGDLFIYPGKGYDNL